MEITNINNLVAGSSPEHNYLNVLVSPFFFLPQKTQTQLNTDGLLVSVLKIS